MMNWYVMTVFNTKEKSIKAKIEEEIEERGMQKLVNRVLVPTEQYFKLVKNKKVKAEKVSYPGYIMIECEATRELKNVLTSIKGVVNFLGNMSKGEVRNMLKKVDDMENDNYIPESNLIVGQKIEIIDGAFTSFTGSITEVNSKKQKVTVDVTIFNRKTSLELSFEQING